MATKLQAILEASINEELVLAKREDGEWKYMFLSCSQILSRETKHFVLLPDGDWFTKEELLKRAGERRARYGQH